MSYLLRCPDCSTPVGLIADEKSKCKCGAEIVAVGTPDQTTPPRVSGLPRKWWATWDGTAPKAATDAVAAYETANAATIAKLQTAADDTRKRQGESAYSGKKVSPEPFSMPEKMKPGVPEEAP